MTKRRIHASGFAATLAAALLFSAGCDDSGGEGSGSTEEPATEQKKQGVAPAGEQDESSPPGAAGSEGSGDDSPQKNEKEEEEPDPGWEFELSGDEGGRFSGFSVLHGHAGKGKRIRLVPEMKAGADFKMNFTMRIGDLRGEATGSYEVDHATLSIDDLNLECQHPVRGNVETEMTLEMTAYNDTNFRGTFEGTMQCEPRNEEEKKDPPRIAISGDFVDN